MKKNYPILGTILALLLLGTSLPTYAQYCTTGLYTYGCGIEWIGGFSTTGGITNISNSSTSCTGGLNSTYYNTMTHTGAMGSTVNFSLINGASCCSENVRIFVDWNIDGDWNDVGEDMAAFSVGASATYNGSFTVPFTAIPGTTRLRVRMVYGGTAASISPCASTTYGEVEDYNFIVTSPCVAPTNPNATNITSQTATVSWTPPTPSIGSDYIVTTSATPPSTGYSSTTGNTANITGLTPSTQYYLYVRNVCSTSSISAWVTHTFTTLPPCKPPVNFHTTNLQPTSTTINWDPWPSAINYDYVVDQTRDDPTTTTGIKNVTTTGDNLTNLDENTWYYVHIRSHCYGNEISDWGLDSFLTPIPCRAPVLNVTHINTNHAVTYWDAVPTALYYEYAISTSATPPPQGTRYDFTSIQTSALYDGKDYYIHVRSHCSSVGVAGTSDWGTASFKTFPVSVSGVNNENVLIEAYPNPVDNILNINVYGVVAGNSVIAITDLGGKMLKQQNINAAKTAIDMSDLASGVYLLKYTDDERSETIKITKQ